GKIKDVEDTIAVGWTWISTLKKILFYAEKLCQIVGIWGKIQIVLGFIQQIPGIGSASSAPAAAADTVATKSQNMLYKFCDYVSCKKTLWGDWYTGAQEQTTKDMT
ncbi:MAG: hypothetical protein KKC75_06640, partial [Nanoarchaeota archaeon]|nr:hypothetical protein [Nanoarchaeota archaeon]